MKFKYSLLILNLAIFAIISGCSKDEPKKEQKPVDTVFIRIENTSVLDYLNVKIQPDPSKPGFTETGALKTSALSEYYGFVTCNDIPSIEVKLTENRSTGISSSNRKLLSGGKYTLQVYVPNMGDIIITPRLIKDE